MILGFVFDSSLEMMMAGESTVRDRGGASGRGLAPQCCRSKSSILISVFKSFPFLAAEYFLFVKSDLELFIDSGLRLGLSHDDSSLGALFN